MPQIKFKKAGEMNLVGYILRALIERNLETPAGARAFAKMKGRVLVGASAMEITLNFSDGDLIMSVGRDGKPDARVRGSMQALLDVSLGKGMIGPLLSGRLKVGGKAWRLLRMLKLMKAEGGSWPPS